MELAQASGTPSQTKPPRDYTKCRFCRESKRKCEEYDYDKGEKCRGCVVGNKPCGPRIPHSAHDPEQSAPTSFATPLFTSPSRSTNTTLPSSSSSGTRSFAAAPYTPSPSAAALSFATPDSSDRLRLKGRLSFSQDAGNDARTLSAKDSVRVKLIELGSQGELFAYLGSRLEVAVDASPEIGLRPHDDVENMITSIREYVIIRCNLICKEIGTLLPQITSRLERELYYCSFNKKLAHLLSLAPARKEQGKEQANNDEAKEPWPQSNEGDDFKKFKYMHYAAAFQLASICEENGDFPEAFKLKQHLVVLEKKYCLPPSPREELPSREDFENLSLRIGEAFKNLEVPSRLTHSLPKMSNIFPPAHLAVHHHCASTAHDILNAGADPRACDILKRQILHIAAETGDGLLLQLALGRQEGATSARDIYNQTALCIAAYVGKLDLFTSLLAAGGPEDTSDRDIAGRSVLGIASGAGNIAIVQHLLEKNYCRANDAQAMELLGVPSALYAAARGGHRNCAEILLDYGASALVECQGLTPAQIARAKGHTDLADLLNEAERVQEQTLSHNIHLAEKRWMETLVEEDPLTSEMSSSSASPYALPPAMKPSISIGMPTPLLTSVPNVEHHHQLPREIARSLSQAGLAMTSSPRAPETLSPSLSTLPRKRSHPSSSHRSSPCPSDISSHVSSEPSKRHHTSAF